MAGHQVQNRIRNLRFNTNEMTQAELAAAVGVTRQTIITIENGKYSPSLELAFRIALAFGVRIEDVFSYGTASSVFAERKSNPGIQAEPEVKEPLDE